MGIFCQINLFKSSDVYRPGQKISGLIKYVLDEPTEVEKIIISLKGKGVTTLEVSHNNRYTVYKSSEVYADIDYVAQEEKVTIPEGSHEIKFNFIMPLDIPSSVKFSKLLIEGYMKCKILYYLRIKFERTGFLNRHMHFKKKITLISGAKPHLLREPVVYGETKTLMPLFSSKSSLVNIKATIFNSVIPQGGKVNIHYEIENSSNIIVQSVKIKLVEIFKFKAKGHRKVKTEAGIPDTDVKTKAINCGETQTMPIEINIPPDRYSLDNSKIVWRDYSVKIEAALPIPHRNIVLYIPVQIEILEENIDEQESNDDTTYDEPPPSYWIAMGETKKEDDDNSDGEYENEKGKE